MRFYGTLKFNGYVVGKGYGSNKKQVKSVAARVALMNLVPSLYRQWKAKLEPHGSPPLTEEARSSGPSAHSSVEKRSLSHFSATPEQLANGREQKENIEPSSLFQAAA